MLAESHTVSCISSGGSDGDGDGSNCANIWPLESARKRLTCCCLPSCQQLAASLASPILFFRSPVLTIILPPPPTGRRQQFALTAPAVVVAASPAACVVVVVAPAAQAKQSGAETGQCSSARFSLTLRVRSHNAARPRPLGLLSLLASRVSPPAPQMQLLLLLLLQPNKHRAAGRLYAAVCRAPAWQR